MTVREEFEKWLTSTIDCKFEYDPVTGYLPQEVYQLYQAWQAAWNAANQNKGVRGDMTSTITHFEIIGTVGAGISETAHFNPREFIWECAPMDLARYAIATRDEAEALLDIAKETDYVTDIRINEVTTEIEE